MPNRKLPFGYCLRNGQVQASDDEEEIVQMIFQRYAQGDSYQTLTDILNAQRVPYLPGARWNKNMVARIIQDERTTGTAGYPPIVSQEQFQCANSARPARYGALKRPPQHKPLQALARCGLCSGFIRRTPSEMWSCPRCMAAPVKLTDATLIVRVRELLAQLVNDPDTIAAPPPPPVSNLVQNLETKLSDLLNDPDFDEEAAKAKAIALAAARFDVLGSEEYETLRIHDLLSKTEQSSTLDTDLLGQITAAILIHPTGSVSLKLKNGQIIEGS